MRRTTIVRGVWVSDGGGRDRLFGLMSATSLALGLATAAAAATTYDWDNWSGDNEYQNAINWRPGGGPPGAVDSAVFDGQLENNGIGKNGVHVIGGTAVNDVQVIDTATIDLTIGNGTTASQFRILRSLGDGLVLGNSSGDTATLNLLGGWLDTYRTVLSGRTSLNVSGSGSYWDSADVFISGDTTTNTAGIGLALGGEIATHGNLDIGSDTGSGRVVIDGSVQHPFDPTPLWTVSGIADVGPTSTTGFNFGQLTLQDGGRVTVQNDLLVHGTSEATSKTTVRTGGQLTVADLLQIGPYGTLELSDSNSRISLGRFMKTGRGGSFNWTGGKLELTNSGLVIDSAAPDSVFGHDLRLGAGKSLVLSSAETSDELVIGDTAPGLLRIEGGGSATSTPVVVVGKRSSYLQSSLIVTGTQSTFSAGDTMYVGPSGGQGRLDILQGGHVDSFGAVKVGPGIGVGTVDVHGIGSAWKVVGPIELGQGYIDLYDQASITSGSVTVAGGAGATGASIDVDGYVAGIGVPARWDVNGSVAVEFGFVDFMSSFTIRRNGRVAVTSNFTVGAQEASLLSVQSEGQLDVGGTLRIGSLGKLQLNTGQITAGVIDIKPSATFDWTGGTLHVTQSDLRIDTSTDASLGIGSLIVGSGKTLRVRPITTGVGLSLYVGGDGPGVLTIQDGGVTESWYGDVGVPQHSGASGPGTVTVRGRNSRWTIDQSLTVGCDPDLSASELTISDHGLVSADSTEVGVAEGHARVSVDGSGSSLRSDFVSVGGGVGATFLGDGEGTLTVSNRATVEATTRLWINSPDDTVNVLSNGQINAGVVTNQGRVHLAGGTISTARFDVKGGVLEGQGTILADEFFNEGLVSPSGGSNPSYGKLVLSGGAYTQTVAGTLLIDVAGLNPGVSYDVLQVNGPASLGGSLATTLSSFGGYMPQVGDRFTFLTATGGITGRFAFEEVIPSLWSGVGMFVDYDAYATSLAVTSWADFDTDFDVDVDDLHIWQAGYATGTQHTQGDADFDGDVDGRDFLIWQRQFGSCAASLSVNMAVPEPGTTVLSLLASISFCVQRRARARGGAPS